MCISGKERILDINIEIQRNWYDFETQSQMQSIECLLNVRIMHDAWYMNCMNMMRNTWTFHIGELVEEIELNSRDIDDFLFINTHFIHFMPIKSGSKH